VSVTSKELAARLGLSQSTVSRVLSGAAGHRVSAATCERVRRAAAELDYRPNAVARSLRRGRTHVVGVYTRHNYDARNEFLGAILGGLQRACGRRRLDLLLFSGQEDRSPHDIVDRVLDGRVDGLLLHAAADDPVVARLIEAKLPAVALADAVPGLPTATADDAGGMKLLLEWLAARGYQRYCFVAPRQSLSSVERRQAAFEAVLAAGPGVEASVEHIDYEDAGPLTASLAARTAGEDRRPIVACCWNDRSAYALARACLAEGLDVPGRVAVTGFDGFLDTKLPARRLVSVACPWDRVAERALDLLDTLLDGGAAPSEVCLPVRLVEGDTA
jgi:DNA-binding LacI/PurR family transcriptional regulator